MIGKYVIKTKEYFSSILINIIDILWDCCAILLEVRNIQNVVRGNALYMIFKKLSVFLKRYVDMTN